MSTDRLNRAQTTAAVLLVAAIAAVVSYVHIEQLAVAHHQDRLAAILIPLSIDGTVAAMSGVMLSAARRQMPAPRLARVMLGLAVVATLGANVISGAASGIVGALIAGWPAVAFVGCVEVSIGMVRRMRGTHPETVIADAPGDVPEMYIPGSPDALTESTAPALPGTPAPVPERTSQPRPERTASRPAKRTASALDARAEYDAELAAGRIPSVRLTMRAQSVGSKRAKEIRAQLERDRDDAESEPAPGRRLKIAGTAE